MSKLVSPYEYISALSNLNNRTIAKKYRFKNSSEIINSKFSDLEQEINTNFKNDLGFGLRELENEEMIKRFEVRLDLEYSKITNKKIIKYPVDDEINLLRKGRKANKEFLRNYEVSVGDQVKDYLKRLKINIPTVKSYCRTCDELTIIPNSSEKTADNILLIKDIKYRNKEYKAFAHLNHVQRKSNELSVGTFLVLPLEATANFNPIRYFINILNWFGVQLRLEYTPRKFFLEEKLFQKTYSRDHKVFEVVDQNNREEMAVHAMFKNTNLYTEINFLYGINYSKYFKFLNK